MALLRRIYGGWVVEVWVGGYLEPISAPPPRGFTALDECLLRLDSFLGGLLFFVFYVLLLGLIC